MVEKRKVTKIFALFLTLGVLIIFILSAPAQAYILRLNASDEEVQKGDKISFVTSIEIGKFDKANITSVQLKLSGPLDIVCKFKTDGEVIDGCDGFIIQKIENCSTYGSYGYGYCEYGYYSDDKLLKYNITYDTGTHFAGVYKTSIGVLSGNNVLDTESGEDIKVIFSEDISLIKSCSIRAKNGDATVNGEDFGKSNKINFYIPKEGARPGTGYVAGQKGRTTFSYKFDVTSEVLERDENHTAVSVTGKYKVGLGKENEEKSVLLLDKRNGNLNVIGDNVIIEYMDVNFNQGNC